MTRVERPSWQQFWRVVSPYWQSSERAKGIALLSILLGLSVSSSLLLIWETFPKGEVISALAAKDAPRFTRSLGVLVGVLLLTVPVVSLKSYVQARLGLQWRRWFTEVWLQDYLRDRRFYHLTHHPEIDNPDQRIAEDIRSFTQQSLFFCDFTVRRDRSIYRLCHGVMAAVQMVNGGFDWVCPDLHPRSNGLARADFSALKSRTA